MRSYEYHRAASLPEAFALVEEFPQAALIAGGTDMLVRIKNRELSPPVLVSVRNLPELSGIEVGPTTRIGAGTTITDLIEHADLAARFPVLIEGAKHLGSTQIRNVGTIGGNLANASPCSDTALPLLVHEARVELARADGSQREVPLADFFTGPKQTCIGPGEIMTAVLIDEPAAGTRTAFRKKGRVKMDIATASVAVLLELDGAKCARARIAAGSVAPTPVRLPAVEQLLEGATLDAVKIAEAREAAEAAVSPITDVRSTAEYRRQIVGVYVERSLAQLLGEVRP